MRHGPSRNGPLILTQSKSAEHKQNLGHRACLCYAEASTVIEASSRTMTDLGSSGDDSHTLDAMITLHLQQTCSLSHCSAISMVKVPSSWA